MASMMVDEPGQQRLQRQWWQWRKRLRRWPMAVVAGLMAVSEQRVETGTSMTVSEPGGSGFDSGSDGGGSGAGKRAAASMMVGGSGKRHWEVGGGDNFDDGQRARRRLASDAGKQLPAMGNR
uniref:DUF834 domain-containing protein n=1 Tax=Oryza glumipatula TaxID=40148 RepID=A0A0E0AU74_9ORYZ